MITIIATIKPHHLHNIRIGLKLWEVRKTAPNIPTPFRVLCCESGSAGQIKAEFICDYRRTYANYAHVNSIRIHGCGISLPVLPSECCLTEKEIREYAGNADYLHFLHISNMIDYCSTKGYYVRNISEFGLKHAPQSWQYLREVF